ncbi:MAG: hypothetical protein ACFCBW_03825 [Candidatus Competibacterales bacterium]
MDSEDYDNPWGGILGRYLKAFAEPFCPHLHRDIDRGLGCAKVE